MPRPAPLLAPLLHAALARQKAAVEEILARAGETFSADDLHDVRVALRRTSALAQLARGVPRKGDGEALHEAARALRRVLSRSRTSEVLRELLEKRARRDPARAALLGKIAGRLAAEEASPGRRSLAPRVRRLRAAFARRDAELAGGAPLESALRRRVEKRLEKRRRALLAFGVPSKDDLHALRIAAKQLRYELEPLKGVIPGAARLLPALRDFQTVAGDAHDRLELAAEAGRFEPGPRDRATLAALCASLARDAARAVAKARREAGELLPKVRRARLELPG